MAPKRTLGGPRVIGSTRSQSPAPGPQHKHSTTLLTPSDISVSLTTQVSDSQTSAHLPDISSRVSLGQLDHGAAGPATSRLACPICNEEMVTLLQLNRHLDDAHQHLEEVEQDEVKTWFKKQMLKAKKFEPFAALNQKLKELDVFESNDADSSPSSAPVLESAPAAAPPVPTPRVMDADEVVTKEHWQRQGDLCSDPMCGLRLGGANGRVNCRHCGKLFCDEHTMYQMKLSRAAHHEPVRGVWCRVCETCYKSREAYNDHNGFERDHTNDFVAIRRRTVDKAHLEMGRLEKRLTRLTQLLINPPEDPERAVGGSWWSFAAIRNQQRRLEQSVVTWEDDSAVLQCPFCQQEFTNYSFRRHHCRLCGRVVCGDPLTGCSTEIGLNIAAMTNIASEKSLDQVSVDVRMCKDCKHTLFSKSDFARELSTRPPDQRAYDNLTQFERGIRLMLPKFQTYLQALQDPEKTPTPAQLAEATRVRKRLMDAFSQYDVAARRIRDLPTDSPTQQRLQKAIYQQASNFLHLHMLPLKSLPRILKHASPGPSSNRRLTPTAGAGNNGALAQIKYSDHLQVDENSQVSSVSALSVMEAEEKELKERLIVLQEQKFFVEQMLADARKRRKADEVTSLTQNVQDLSREIDHINLVLSGMDFQGAHEALGGPG